MKEILEDVKNRVGKTYEDLEYLLNALKEVLIDNDEDELAHQIPWVNDLEDMDLDQVTPRHLQLYSMVFQILNMVEINGAVQHRREKEEESLDQVNGLWARNFKILEEAGVSKEEIMTGLSEIKIEPVLTAHPTEAKRATVLEQHRTLYLLLVQRENTMYTTLEQENIRHNIKQSLYRLFKTGEIYLEKPDVSSELRNILHYLVNVFPEVIPILDRRLVQAWEFLGHNRWELSKKMAFPRITFGDWVGGDRDGHPLVTASVTRDTLLKMRLNAFVVLRRVLTKLVQQLSFTCELEDATPELQKRVAEMTTELGDRGVEALDRNKGEAFRQLLNLSINKLPIEIARGHATRLAEHQGSYVHSGQLVNDLKILYEALVAYGAKSIAYDDVTKAIRLVQTFGFHLAAIDIRQNSAFHDRAVEQLLKVALEEDTAFGEWSEEKRLALVTSS
jgi:phosphoenolpyruvate carboxylase